MRTLMPMFKVFLIPLETGDMMPREKSRDSTLLQTPEERSSRGPAWFGGAAAVVYWGPVSLCPILGALPPASVASTSVVAVEL